MYGESDNGAFRAWLDEVPRATVREWERRYAEYNGRGGQMRFRDYIGWTDPGQTVSGTAVSVTR